MGNITYSIGKLVEFRAMEPLIKSGWIILGCTMIKIKARNASNSRAIAKFRNAEIDYFVPKMVGHDLISSSI